MSSEATRLQQAVENRRDRVEVILAKWKTWPFIRMLWDEYRNARSEYLKHKKQWDEAIEALPARFQKRIARARRKASDLAWFNYMELPYVIGSMETARQAADVFQISHWSSADRQTFSECEDVGQLIICWDNLISELKENEAVDLSDIDTKVPWLEYEMTEVRDIMALVSMLLD